MFFIITEEPNLMFYEFDEHQGPQAMVFALGQYENLMEKYHKNLKHMDGQTVEEWLDTAKNAETLFAPIPEDDRMTA
jgi:hypothetical protein